MVSLRFSLSGLRNRLAVQLQRRSGLGGERRPAYDLPDAARARRKFIQDMLTRNPDAYSSELDVQNMMLMFPGKF